MAETLNDILSRTPSGGTAVLPSGEFEGPVYITKPLRLVGNNTTIWAKRGSVIEVTTGGATLEGLRVELTEGDINDAAIVTSAKTEIRDVEILGGCKGFGAEDAPFDFPKTIALGKIAADETNTYLLKVNVPSECEIHCGISGVSFSPKKLSAGRNDVTLTVNGLSSMTFLYGEITMQSMFKRRIYLSGRPASDGEHADGKLIYEAPEREVTSKPQPVQNAPATDVISVNSPAPLNDLPPLDMRKGQRISLYQYIGNKCAVNFSAMKPNNVEIDPYIFLLDGDEKAFGEKGLVFFGNERSQNGSVCYFPADGRIEFDFSTVDYRVKRIALAYSIYGGGGAGNNFSAVKSPKISIVSNGEERITYSMYGLSDEVTVVALEFYQYKGEWKVSAVGAGYRDGLVKLCNSYGIEVTD